MGKSIEVTFVCERCEAKAIVKVDDLSDCREYGAERKLSGYDYLCDTVLSIKVSGGSVYLDKRLSDEDSKRASMKLLCPGCISKYEDMIRDIVKFANKKVKTWMQTDKEA